MRIISFHIFFHRENGIKVLTKICHKVLVNTKIEYQKYQDTKNTLAVNEKIKFTFPGTNPDQEELDDMIDVILTNYHILSLALLWSDKTSVFIESASFSPPGRGC